jgi:hypothetical protein
MRRFHRHEMRRALALFACLLAIVALPGQPESARAAAEPTLTIEPERGACGSPVIVRGSNFTPGQKVRFLSALVGVRDGTTGNVNVPVVPDDGAFAFEVNTGRFCSFGYLPPVADGTQLRLSAVLDTRPGGSPIPLAEALFTIDSLTTPSPDAPGANPSLTLDPEGGLCTDRVVVRGEGFLPNEVVTLTGLQTAPFEIGAVAVFARVAAEGGSFTAEFVPEAVAVQGCGKCGVNGCSADPTGEEYRITAVGEAAPGGAGVTIARTLFTVAGPLPPLCFPETGQCIRNRFKGYWLVLGGLDLFGYPLSGELTETLASGNEATIQYFERARLEYHPENAPPHDVLVGQLGRRALAECAQVLDQSLRCPR